jgi:serine/threonine-protein kinase
MGVVWAATHEVTRKRVALKVLSARLGGRDEMHKRFLAEARAAASIDHPHVIDVSDVFELDDGTPVMVQDVLEGETLAQRLEREGPLDLETTAAILLPVVDAVAAAHDRGVVHRDLKPDNVFLVDRDEETFPMVLDFGIAKLLDPDADPGDSVDTGTGTMLGSTGYMSPEQGFGEKDIDGRADLWALGVILYECLAGFRPIEADNLGQYLKRVMSDAITPLHAVAPDLPEPVTHTVMALLETDRDARLSDLDSVVRALTDEAAAVPPFEETPTSDARPAEAGPTGVLPSPDAASSQQRSRIWLGAVLVAGVAGVAAWQIVSTPATSSTAPKPSVSSPAAPPRSQSATAPNAPTPRSPTEPAMSAATAAPITSSAPAPHPTPTAISRSSKRQPRPHPPEPPPVAPSPPPSVLPPAPDPGGLAEDPPF